MKVTKKNNKTESFQRSKIEKILINASKHLKHIDIENILMEIELQIFNEIKTQDIHSFLISTCLQYVQLEPEYSDLAAQLLLFDLYKQCLGKDSFVDLQKSYEQVFPEYIKKAVEKKLLDSNMLELFDLNRLAKALKQSNDNLLKFNGLFTLKDRYLIKDFHNNEKILEAPQFFWMRVAMGISVKEDEPTKRAIQFYEKMSRLEYLAATPTLFNSGTNYPQLSSCFVMDLKDSIEGIADSIKDVMFLEKHSGGIGMNITRLRGSGSVIESIQGKSSGPVPFLKMFDSVVAGVSQGGRRRGSMAIYCEPWHINIEDFIALRNRSGDQNQRIKVMNTVIWANDEFFERVKKNQSWYLFDPKETPDLVDLYGQAFLERYEFYIKEAQAGNIQNYRVVKAKDLFNKILNSILETSHPWITFKDRANEDCPINHKMLVHSTNLCTEIFLPTDPETTAVCNLASLNLSKHLNADKSDFDYEKLRESTSTAIRQLDNVIDINYYPTEKAKKGNQAYRPIGLGVMGYVDALEQLKVPYESARALELTDKIFSLINKEAVKTSVELAEERGLFPEYAGSRWEKEEIKIRNGTLLAVAPTVTISMIAGTSQGMDPNYSNFFTRHNIAGKFAEFNFNLVEALKEIDLWESVREQILVENGSVQNIEEIPAEIKELFKTAFEIDQNQVIDLAAKAQKHIQQGISRNIYVSSMEIEELGNLYLRAYETKTIKSLYYTFVNASTKAESKFLYKEEKPKVCSIDPSRPDFENCEACQ